MNSGEEYLEYDEPSLSLVAKRHDEGHSCTECGVLFTEAHGKLTACEYCWKRLPFAERYNVLRATHPEANKEAHRAEARKRRASKAQ